MSSTTALTFGLLVTSRTALPLPLWPSAPMTVLFTVSTAASVAPSMGVLVSSEMTSLPSDRRKPRHPGSGSFSRLISASGRRCWSSPYE